MRDLEWFGAGVPGLERHLLFRCEIEGGGHADSMWWRVERADGTLEYWRLTWREDTPMYLRYGDVEHEPPLYCCGAQHTETANQAEWRDRAYLSWTCSSTRDLTAADFR